MGVARKSRDVGSISALEHKQIVDRATVMRLRGGTVTDDAMRLSDRIYEQMIREMVKPLRKSSESKLRAAIGAMLADLLIAENKGVWTRRSMDDHSFRAQRVNRSMFRRVKSFFEESGLLQTLPGKSFFLADSLKPMWSGHTCFRGTEDFIVLALTNGIDVASAEIHFTSALIACGQTNLPTLA